MGLGLIREGDYFITTFQNFTLKLYDGYYDDLPILVESYLSRYKIKEGDIIVDAGAYLGAFSLIASRLTADSGKIIAFEAEKASYSKLLNNIRLNNATNIIPINKGLWDRDAILPFNNVGNGESSFFFDGAVHNSIERVPVVRLDSELERLGFERVNFIKMDIEGAELFAIEGCKKFLKDNECAAAIAAYHIVNGERTSLQIEKITKELGKKTEILLPQEHLTIYINK